MWFGKQSQYNGVDEAIRRLTKAKESINFNSVATEARLSKATLYNNSQIASPTTD